jgi:hypothetical protein
MASNIVEPMSVASPARIGRLRLTAAGIAAAAKRFTEICDLVRALAAPSAAHNNGTLA